MTIEGEPAELWRVQTQIETTILGAADSFDVIEVRRTGELGEGTVVLRHRESYKGAAEVRWSIYAEGDAASSCQLFCFGDDGERTVELTVTPPPDSTAPDPIITVPVRIADERPRMRRVDLSIPAGTGGFVVETREAFGGDQVRVHVDGVDYSLQRDTSTFIPLPAGCEEGCDTELLFLGLGNDTGVSDAPVSVSLFVIGDDGTATASRENEGFELFDLTVALDVPPPPEDRQDLVQIPVYIQVPADAPFGDVVTVSAPEVRHFEAFHVRELEDTSNETASGQETICFVDEVGVFLSENEPSPEQVEVVVSYYSRLPFEGPLIASQGDGDRCLE